MPTEPTETHEATPDPTGSNRLGAQPARHTGLPAVSPDGMEEAAADEMDRPVPPHDYHHLPVVALGGSAGSIQALKAFFQALPTDTGLAYVVILHLSPQHESTLPALLQGATAMPVKAVEDSDRVRPNCVYVIPPGKHLTVVDGYLRLTPLEPERGTRVAVDLFFRSLADTHGPQATAVVLSGADGDGAVGLKRIKERGGLTVAQDPEEAEHPSMPRTAIDTGMVDWVLPAAEMPARLVAYHAAAGLLRLPAEDGPQPAKTPAAPGDEDEVALREVLALLRTRTRRDFSYYKRGTIVRRVARRMQINEVTTLPGYLSFLRTHPGEAGALLQDLLISVTNFFRDREAFAALEAQVIPALFTGKGPDDTVRVWCPACATGEEAYSMAMLLTEYADTLDRPPAVQVFGCDLDEAAITQARAGLYPATVAADVSAERLERFFFQDPRGYRVRRELRERVLFADHDLLRDAPFSRLDLVSCRNLLIYLNPEAQARVFEILHFALNINGWLFLGTSESVNEEQGLFTPTDKKNHLYLRRTVPRVGLPVPMGAGTPLRALQANEPPVVPDLARARNVGAVPAPARKAAPSDSEAALADLHFDLVESYAPPSVVVDERHHIVHLSEHAVRFVRFVPGKVTTHLLDTVHPALRMDLRAALFQVADTGRLAEVFGLPVELEGVPKRVDLRVAPAKSPTTGYLLVTFLARDPDSALVESGEPTTRPQIENVVRQLERQEEVLRTQLRDTLERYEVSEEEHKAGNEELQAINEELRAATEELETSREELQSLNEELTTVNLELKHNVDELGRANSDLQNLMDATSIATVFLDRQLKVKSYTPTANDLFYLIPSDVGRPLAHVKHRLDYPELLTDAQRVLTQLAPTEREVRREEGGWFLARLLPYRTLEKQVAGVVLTFVDVTERKQIQDALQESETQFRSFVAATSDTVYKMSAQWKEMHFLDGKQFLTDTPQSSPTWLETYIPLEDQPTVVAAIQEAIAHKRPFELEHRVIRVDGTPGWTFSRAIPLLDARGELTGWIGAASDVTERRRAEEALYASQERLRESEARFRAVANIVPDLLWSSEPDGAMVWYNERWLEYTGQSLAEAVGWGWTEAIHPEDREAAARHYHQALESGRPLQQEQRIRRADGAYRSFLMRAEPLRDEKGKVMHWFGSATDIDGLVRARGEAEASSHAKDHFLAVLSHELRTPLMPITMALATISRRQDLPEAVRKVHEMIRRNVDIEARFIDDMLDVTRIARGKMEIMRKEMDLHEVVRRAVEVATPDIEAKGQRLTLALEGAECPFHGDFVRLQQVFWNLLKNASKFTPRGGSIEIRSWGQDGADRVVEVTDTGIGMEAKALERIFDPFEQASVSITREFGGLGLGLAIAKATVEAHGGTLLASSPGPGQGATFTVSLPLAASPVADVGPVG